VNEKGGAAIGIRTSNDKSLALQLAIGFRIFVCDNMAFAGDLIALRRKHTGNLDLHREFAEGIGRYVAQYPKLQENISWWKERTVSKERGKQLIYDIFKQRIVPLRLFHPSVSDWEAAEDKTMWRLHNCMTAHIKTLRPAPAFTATLKLIMSPEVRPLTIDGVAHEEPHMSHGGKGKQHASDRGTIWGVTPADNARYLPARTGNERYPCHLD
jgi:hypothetical protein